MLRSGLYRMHRYRRRLMVRTLRRPEPLFVLDAYQVRSDLEAGVR